jgi:coenzyme PQQ precursor peptide PqqA
MRWADIHPSIAFRIAKPLLSQHGSAARSPRHKRFPAATSRLLTQRRRHCTLGWNERGDFRVFLTAVHQVGQPGGLEMKLEWSKPEVTEQEVGLEVTSYAPAELDRT